MYSGLAYLTSTRFNHVIFRIYGGRVVRRSNPLAFSEALRPLYDPAASNSVFLKPGFIGARSDPKRSSLLRSENQPRAAAGALTDPEPPLE